MTGRLITIAAWLVLAYVITSAYEHFGHRFMMHGRVAGLVEYFEKHVLHHVRFAPFRKYRTADDPAGQWVGVDLGAPMMFFASAIIWGPVALFVSKTGAIVLATFFSLHGEAWTWFHREIHYPRGRWFARVPVVRAYFRFVLRYHGRHHQRQSVNFTVLCPLMDQVMGKFGGLLPNDAALPRSNAGAA
jgi:hypothetical protein